ncbi:precorrin-2 dehydrogenase / sirohydrochlorin ferrochelatase [Paenibacillus sophorae]|uniref:precorrin-2 dehydrogenase n=1 Tax=Paenibacillus sophorae TaxID=1333845 RepID=A0A1H8QHT5_9BACL|nr:NAD(P)-dependent oxidoreductase [Paenibacillus sophorae]QWU15117.1 bifunctional precorrin-2 dehydrogenase/sirohydrochlorin ferrochelatase [Paenibacillus sophorae]SEO53779.1 precorrin-2 dehydrogenase / sirohydrochlorin ferrochelatase [Paenibacillus sophorae]
MTVYLPIMLDCRGKHCVVVGGGKVAERKTLGLLEAGAAVTIISPALTPRLAELTDNASVVWLSRTYAPGDARGAFLVYAATDDPAVNGEVAREADSLGVPVNVGSHAEAGSFITPGVLRRGRLTVAVSTSGAGPGIAARITKLLEETLGDEYEDYLDFLYKMRQEIKRRERSPEVRKRLLKRLGTLNVLDEIREGAFTAWDSEQIETWIAQHREE